MSGKPLVALILLAVLSIAACQAKNGSGTSDAKSDPAGSSTMGGGGY